MASGGKRGNPREPVLVVAHADGFVETFANRNVDVRFEVLPEAPGARGEMLAEHYLDLILPQRYRDLYYPAGRRAVGMVRRLPPAEIAQRQWDQSVLKGIKEAEAILRGDAVGGVVWTL